MSDPPTKLDPPLEPMDESVRWCATTPSAIVDDLELATLIVRIGMATNALDSQLQAARSTLDLLPAAKTRTILCWLVTSAALTNEAIKVVSSGMARLRPLAHDGGAPGHLLERVGKLSAGKHPASEVLERARNKLGFHWDADIVGPSVLDFARNEKVIWIEGDSKGVFVHRLAFEVLAHALFPSLYQPDLNEARRAQMIDAALDEVSDAALLIKEFCTAATFGYMTAVEAERHER